MTTWNTTANDITWTAVDDPSVTWTVQVNPNVTQSGGATDLDDLTDVVITAAASGDILRHNGTNWVDTPGTDHFEAAGAVATHTGDTTAAHAASAISVDASGFNGNLTTSDDTVQEVAQKLDDLSIPNVSGKANIVNTDGDPGITIYVGSVDPDVSYTPAVGDVWIEVP